MAQDYMKRRGGFLSVTFSSLWSGAIGYELRAFAPPAPPTTLSTTALFVSTKVSVVSIPFRSLRPVAGWGLWQAMVYMVMAGLGISTLERHAIQHLHSFRMSQLENIFLIFFKKKKRCGAFTSVLHHLLGLNLGNCTEDGKPIAELTS